MELAMNITLVGKTVEIRLSDNASRALAGRSTPLRVEMELLFSCLIRKRVRFGELDGREATLASDKLAVSFRPVMTHACSVKNLQGAPSLDDFPIANPRPYVPRWLAIDHRQGQWLGEFGY
jgi:hypothetical protein